MTTCVGELDGPGWERHCQKLLKVKYGDDGYQEVPSRFGGDLGIEGFTRSGIAFQCYCPDGNPPPKKLYEEQRDKITRDLRKLRKYKDQLVKLLGDIRISEWHFLTPRYDSRHLVAHCQKKTQDVRSWRNCHHIGRSFTVLLKDEEHFIHEREVVLNGIDYQITIDPPGWSETDEEELIRQHNTIFRTIDEKLEVVISDENRRRRYSALNIEKYLRGQNVLNEMLRQFPDHYQKLQRIKRAHAEKVEHDSIMQIERGMALVKAAWEAYEEELNSQFGGKLDPQTRTILVSEAISSWLVECPLTFRV